MTRLAAGWNLRPFAAKQPSVETRVAIGYNTNHYTDPLKGRWSSDTLKLTSRHVFHLRNRDDFHPTARQKQFIIGGWIVIFFAAILLLRAASFAVPPVRVYPHLDGGDLGTVPAPPLPLLGSDN